MKALNSPIMGLRATGALMLALLFTLPSPSMATEFFAIVESTGRKPFAALDVAVDTRLGAGVNVEFMACDAGGNFVSEFFVPTGARGFASTSSHANLFDLTGGQPMLIRARTAGGAVNSGATLNVRSANGSMTVGVAPITKLDGTLAAAGRVFSVAVGSFRTARLLIANVSGGDVNLDVFQGTDGAPGHGIYSNPRIPNCGHWRVDLSQNEAQSNLVIVSNSPVIVQLVIDDGKAFQSFMVTPNF